MSAGELIATELGSRFLRTQGLQVDWADARTMLKAEERRGANSKSSILSATCAFGPDGDLRARLDSMAPVVITQGFIASDDDGNTVLLGRGGSDTSGAYFAAKIRAQRLEIWTDVPGMFSANPRSTPTARLLRNLHYDEAQEIATSGAKVLHPRCILPARQYRIPLHVYATQAPDLAGTVLSAEGGEGGAQVKAVCTKKGITLVSLESPGMWHQVGFLADAFQVFKAHGMSVDLVSTSETNVTVSLDPAANTLDNTLLSALVTDLSRLCRVQVIGPCASVSLVGRNIRAILHQLGDAFEFFEEQKIYLVSQAANDLNFTFVVDENQGDRLVEQLHELLIRPVPGDPVLGPTWEQLFLKPKSEAARVVPWWRQKRTQLLAALGDEASAFVYDLETISAAARALRGVKALGRVHYSMKANSNPQVLKTIRAEGVDFECVSRGEVERALQLFPDLDPGRILYTPNFAPRAEYAWAFERGIRVTVDNLYALTAWADLFRNREIFARIDTGVGRGHHHHVRTAGAHSKFGVPVAELKQFLRHSQELGVRIVGLQAHVGSGIFDVTQLGAPGASTGRYRPAFHGCESDRRRWRTGCAGARRSAGRGSAEVGHPVAGSACRASAPRILDGARTVSRGGGRCAAGAGDAVEVEGRGSLCRRQHRHELPDTAGAVRRVPRDRQSHPRGRAPDGIGQRRRPDLRERGCARATTGCCRRRARVMCF